LIGKQPVFKIEYIPPAVFAYLFFRWLLVLRRTIPGAALLLAINQKKKGSVETNPFYLIHKVDSYENFQSYDQQAQNRVFVWLAA
jgi:hypothetical protein